MENKTEIKVITRADTEAANRDKLVLGTVLLVGILIVLLIVTGSASGF